MSSTPPATPPRTPGAPDAWRRVVALLVQSFEAPARGPLPASFEHDALYRAMFRAGPAAVVAGEPDADGG
ncbi:hypothetical protein AB0E25_18655 [Streptomyces bobili]|uniref:hypothetical protein n=1 Tax=Streptomyces bobili TaxID=67280 RepID=UPI0033CE4EA4